jgi:hypothetical protein
MNKMNKTLLIHLRKALKICSPFLKKSILFILNLDYAEEDEILNLDYAEEDE